MYYNNPDVGWVLLFLACDNYASCTISSKVIYMMHDCISSLLPLSFALCHREALPLNELCYAGTPS